jgi:hypothetical protein
VARAEAARDGADRALVGDVHHHHLDLAAPGCTQDLAPRPLPLLGVAHREDHVRAEAGELLRRRAPDAGARPGDDAGLPREIGLDGLAHGILRSGRVGL